MKIIKSKRKGNIVQLKIEESSQEVERAIDLAFKRIVKKANLPGFRKGKVPRTVFEQNFGKQMLIEEGLQDAVNVAYQKGVLELDLKVIDYPKNIEIGEYKENTAVEFTCDVEVIPEVKIGKYKGIKVKKENVAVSKDQVNEQLDQLRERAAEYVEVARAAQNDDIIRCHTEAKTEGYDYEPWTRKNTGLKLGLGSFGAEFDEKLTGMTKGEAKTFSVNFGTDFGIKDLAGKTVEFNVEIAEIREKKLPELTDEFISKFSQFKSVEELKADIQEGLEKELLKQADDKAKNELIEQIVNNAKTEIAPVLIERESENSLNHFMQTLSQSGMDLDKYLATVGKNLEDFKSELRIEAEKKVKTELTLDAIAEIESVNVTEEDVTDELKTQFPDAKSETDIQKKLGKTNRDDLEYIIKRKKTLAFLEENAKIS
ncbi:MAG: trigger factor [Candidatus Marinamargulisbacteria bacterium]|jgi:trigger factor